MNPGSVSERATLRVLLIVPPFAALDRPAIGVHLLQRELMASGINCCVLYANALYAQKIGFERYHKIAYSTPYYLIGERVFAHGLELLGHPAIRAGQQKCLTDLADAHDIGGATADIQVEAADIHVALHGLDGFRSALRQKLSQCQADLIGLSCTFQQICSSEWIAHIAHQQQPHATLAIGGGNCDGALALGVSRFSQHFTQVFSGEAEHAFRDYCLGKLKPPGPIVPCAPVADLRSSQTLDYSEYYAQLQAANYPDLNTAWLSYETSRGCWWGQKSHCTFCGLNGSSMHYRCKPAEQALDELAQLYRRHTSKHIFIVDNILPRDYLKSFLPQLQKRLPGCQIFYESKSNLKACELDVFKTAGIRSFQPGIEALSTPLLKLMRKGVSGKANLRLLVNCKRRALLPQWNLLYGFPSDQANWYAEVTRIMPHLHHLPPPTGATPVSLDRFSPLYEQAEQFGIDAPQAAPAYFDIFGDSEMASLIAYHHAGSFHSGLLADQACTDAFCEAASRWADSWQQRIPSLRMTALNEQDCLVVDSRTGEAILNRVSVELARCCFACDGQSAPSWRDKPLVQEALRAAYVLEWEGTLINLVETTEAALSA